ncbi:MAG TPA: RNA polymerase sigma factor [Parvularculaceae bacterium]|nr:RNA polymerase sigma factor [Parvularculaceae bacterium]
MALSDIELVTLAKATQSEAAFAELVRRHQAGLRAFLRKFTRDGAQADDLAQDTLLKAYRAIQGFEGGASFRSWLYAIAWREFLQGKRKSAANDRLAREAAPDADDEIDHSSVSELSIDLQRALASLEENERAAILLCDAAGMSHAEAASALGAPLGSVKTYVARARERLRAALHAEAAPVNASTAKPELAATRSR